MKDLHVKDLINGCGNLWKGLFTQNKEFKVILYYWDNGCEQYRYIEKDAWSWLEDSNYLLYYRDYKIENWHFAHNHLFIEVNYLFNAFNYVGKISILLGDCY